jgi:gliding motility-associated-like protein
LKRILILIILGCSNVSAQNLVPNYSFETMINPTCCVGALNSAQFWHSPTIASPDYFNSCADTISGIETWRVPQNRFGFQYPKTGNGYAGFGPFMKTTPTYYYNYQEYLQTQLKEPLYSGKKYRIEFYVNMADSSNFATDDIGMYLSNTAIGNMSSWEYLQYTPQIESPQGIFLSDTVNWVSISGVYIANGGEKFITIGCFKDYSQIDTLLVGFQTTYLPYSYYYVDDVSVVFCDTVYKAEAGRDTAICPGSGVTIGTHDFGDYTYEWQPIKGLNDTHSPTPYATPTETTTYYLTVHDFMDTLTVDSVTVRVLDCDTMNWTIPNAFTPNGDGKNDIFMPHGKYIRNVEGKIINRWGMEIYSWNDANTGWDGTTKHGDRVDPGVFYYIIKIEFENGEEISKAGTVHVIATE